MLFSSFSSHPGFKQVAILRQAGLKHSSVVPNQLHARQDGSLKVSFNWGIRLPSASAFKQDFMSGISTQKYNIFQSSSPSEKADHDLPSLSVDDLAHMLQKCRREKNVAHALRLHAYMRDHGLETHVLLGNYLVPTLVEIGHIHDAQQVFDRLTCPNEWSVNSLVNGYVKCGKPRVALRLFEVLHRDNMAQTSAHTFVVLLKACAKIKDLERGLELHGKISKAGLLGSNLFVGNALIDMYAKCDVLVRAQDVFDKLPARTIVSWTALIAGYTEHGHGDKALKCFDEMESEGISPDPVTLLCSLKACGSIKALNKGREIHAKIDRKGVLKENIFVGNALIDMYIKCGLITDAHKVFEELLVRDTISWTTLLAGYAEHGYGDKAVKCFEYMQLEGVLPDAAALICSLKACGSIQDLEKGKEIHAEIEKQGLMYRNHAIGNTLVDMYAKCHSLAKAQEVFDKLPVRDVVSWTALISGYAECGCGEEAMDKFERMHLDRVSPNAATYMHGMKACASVGAMEKGGDLHAEIERQGLLDKDVAIGTTLVDMYAKCGSLAKAQQVFDRLTDRDGVAWTALMAGYAQIGQTATVYHVFDRLLEERVKPNTVTFLVLLGACHQTGSTPSKGETYFEAMCRDYGIAPTLEHHTCMMNSLGCLGQLDKAATIVKKMALYPDAVLWRSMLNVCRQWGSVEVGKQAFQHVMPYFCRGANIRHDETKVESIKV